MEDFPPPNEPRYGVTLPLNTPWQKFFWGPNGMRAGWRLLIFSALVASLVSLEGIVVRLLKHRPSLADGLSPVGLLIGEGSVFLIFLVASWVMARIEDRALADYGLPLNKTFGLRFWQGIAIGFVSISALMGALWAAGAFHVSTIALHGADAWKYGGLWGTVFLFVALFEEFSFRGYALFTLATGFGFWPAAVLLSLLFGYVHHGNSGETWLGAFAAGAVGFLFCLLLRRTGDLWMPVGFHAAWDWGETYFYGVPDSGQVAPGHLLDSSLSGPRWLSGGTVGPEASWLCIVLLASLWFAFSVWLREVKYPNTASDSPGSPRKSLNTPFNNDLVLEPSIAA